MTIKPEEMLDHLIELNALKAENARLREALEALIAVTKHLEPCPATLAYARAALQGGKDA